MHLSEMFDLSDLEQAREQGLVNVRHDGEGLHILNYTDRAVFTAGAWDNPAVCQCRGIIVDDENNVRARSWSKFWNYGEHNGGTLDFTAPVEVTDKADGSLGIIYLDNTGTPQVATRGSFFSEPAIHASGVLHDLHNDMPQAVLKYITPLVEIVYPGNRIVLDYGDFDDLILLGSVSIRNGVYFSPEVTAEILEWDGAGIPTFSCETLEEALEMPPRANAEGICVRYKNESKIVKIKQDDYVQLHRIVTGLNERIVWEAMVSGDNFLNMYSPVMELEKTLPEEFHEWLWEVATGIFKEMAGRFKRASLIQEDIWDSLPEEYSRKEFATKAKEYPEVQHLLFAMEDGKDVIPMIMKELKPSEDTYAKPMSEDTA